MVQQLGEESCVDMSLIHSSFLSRLRTWTINRTLRKKKKGKKKETSKYSNPKAYIVTN